MAALAARAGRRPRRPPLGPRAGLLVALLAAAAPCGSSAASLRRAVVALRGADAGSPLQKVVEMLTGMKEKGQQDLNAEDEVFAKYGKFVRLRTAELEQEIGITKAKIDGLVASITKAQSDVEASTGRLQNVDADAGKLEAERKASSELRERAQAEFAQAQTDYEESLYALDRAIKLLHSQNYDRPQAAAALQVEARRVPGLRRVLVQLELLQELREGASFSDQQPSGAAVAAYEFQSGGILATLEKLRDRFRAELGDLQKREMNSQQAHDLEMLHTGNTLASLTREREELAEARAKAAAQASRDEGHLAEAKKALAEAESFLSDTQATFAVKDAVFKENQRLRKEEIEAISQAVEIISSPEVAGTYAGRIKALVQRTAALGGSPPSLLQTRRSSARGGAAVEYLASRAEAIRSRELGTLAARLRANPFAKVIDMVKALLEKLQAEAISEAEHKAYCDEELKTNKVKRESLQAAVERLQEEIAAKGVAVTEMAAEIQRLSEEQASLRSSIAEATEVRVKEKEDNAAAIGDAQAAQVSLKKALLLLKEFYGKESFLQLSGAAVKGTARRKQVPELAAYKGMSAESGGVISMLEVIESDFHRLEVETESAEAKAAAEYEDFQKDAEDALKAKHDAEFKLNLDKDQAEFEQKELQKDLAVTQDQLAAANAYFEELRPSCITVHVSSEERAGRRQEEIEALKQAYEMLDGTS